MSEIIDERIDANGQRVVLTQRALHHINDEHPDLVEYYDDILETVSSELRTMDPDNLDRRRLWARDRGPGIWLIVVVDYGEQPAIIITAFAARKPPPTKELL